MIHDVREGSPDAWQSRRDLDQCRRADSNDHKFEGTRDWPAALFWIFAQ
jgi:hypothetical protein